MNNGIFNPSTLGYDDDYSRCNAARTNSLDRVFRGQGGPKPPSTRPTASLIGLGGSPREYLDGNLYDYNVRKNVGVEETALRAQRLTEYFAGHANKTFQYADDYIKAVRRIYLRAGTFESVRQFMAAVPPSTAILSHITMMNAKRCPRTDLDRQKERKIKPGTHERDRDYFKFQKGNAADTV